ncbi:SDR family NAD(P)-dependent oxidoreductase [Vampirovibrio chlorellavorus]|uniref:SDR family NAD(P)-dependent oxidoreductase n=1 Tax=Vampirovibrio chlorellavorus TaxID=758823 RepID=UPI0026EE0368|nr:3-oxoacyl-ACP reductase family protein [Vampirovibrio chlorellavorus]
MSGLLDGKKAFISGGSRGLGKALCEVFAREGADVAFNYNSNDAEAQDTVRRIEQYGRKAMAFKVSVVDKPAIKQMVADIMAEFGRIDALVNNAAINKADSFVTTTESAWLNVINTNVNGLYYITKPFFKQMLRQRAGSILNLTSIGAIRALPTSVHYATSKAAVIGFTKCLAKEAGTFNVNVNGIAAGIFDTDLGHSLPDKFKEVYEMWCTKGRMGRPEELAEFAAFMVSDRNTYMTGEIITIDGGSVV